MYTGAEERAMHDTAPNSDQEDNDNEERDEGADNSPHLVNNNIEMDAEPMDDHQLEPPEQVSYISL